MNGNAFVLSSTVQMHGNKTTLTLSGLQSDTNYEFRESNYASSGYSTARQNDVKHIRVRAKCMRQLRYFSQIFHEITHGGHGRGRNNEDALLLHTGERREGD